MFQSKLFSAALFTAVALAGPAFAQAPPAKKASGSITTTDIRGSGNTVITSSSGPGSVRVVTNDRGQGNRVIVTHNGKVVLPQKMSYADKDAYLPAVEYYQRQVRQAEREVRRTLDEVDRLLDQLDRVLP